MTLPSLLTQLLERKKMENKSYSLRSLARGLKLSPGFLSDCFNGKKKLPLKHIPKIVRLLDLDEKSQKEIENCILGKSIWAQKQQSPYFNAAKPEYAILKHWYYIAILDLTSIENFQSDPAWIAKRLRVSQPRIEDAITNLIAWGYLEQKDGTYKKKDTLLRFPSSRFHPALKNYHSDMLKRAIRSMQQNPFDQKSYDERSIQGIMLAANSKNIPKAKKILINALYEAAEVLRDGECDRVMHINSLLFRLDKD